MPAAAWDGVAHTADKALAAIRFREDRALEAIAKKPWSVVDELCLRGEHEAALRLAKAAPAEVAKGLAAYVEARRRAEPDREARALLERFAHVSGSRFAAARRWPEVLAAVEGTDVQGDDFAALRLHALRGYLLRFASQPSEAASAYERAALLAERIGWRSRAVRSLLEAASALNEGFDPRGALPLFRRALSLAGRPPEDRGLVVRCLAGLAEACELLADHGMAIEYSERQIQADAQRSPVLALRRLGRIYARLGDAGRALDYAGKALAAAERSGMSRAAAHVAVSDAYRAAGDHERAREHARLALDSHTPSAEGLSRLGGAFLALGEPARARDAYRRALELSFRREFVGALVGLGVAYDRLGEHARARRRLGRALRQARKFGLLEEEAAALEALAGIHLAAGETDATLLLARRGAEILPRLAAGLSERVGAGAKERWTTLLGHGAAAALETDDAESLCFFLESGRAGALLESLGSRDALRSAVIPSDLQSEEGRARLAEVRARSDFRAVERSGDVERIRRSRERLDRTREARARVIERIQRAAKSGAEIVYPRVDGLDAIRGRVRDDEALLLCGSVAGKTVVLVVEATRSRIVRLEVPPDLFADESLRDKRRDWKGARHALKRAFLDPLSLGPGTRRILLSPVGALSYVPLVVATDLDLAYVPSGTSYGLLLAERARRGRDILALGNPDYRTGPGRGDLTPLPGTEREAREVGTVLLLGADASETSLLAAASERPRWRAIHLACHGRLDAGRPMLSSLALSVDEQNDGYLTVMEVFRSRFPSDLVVLSACETARGRNLHAEGVVGFVRAFMFAGAPRVIVSLWTVDDAATRALMVRFHQLWNPPDGTPGLSAATALRQAQRFVQSHEKWTHPYYWAAWQLWGLGD